MADGNTFHDTYAEFVARVSSKQAELAAQGMPTVRVYIDVARFVEWCRAGNRAVDANARAEYAGTVAAQQDRGRTP